MAKKKMSSQKEQHEVAGQVKDLENKMVEKQAEEDKLRQEIEDKLKNGILAKD